MTGESGTFESVLVVNLLKIYHAENESLHRDNFVDEFDKKLKDPEVVIAQLVKMDLIETESDPDVFYLTPETYDLIESGSIQGHIWYKLYPKGNAEKASFWDDDLDDYDEDENEYFVPVERPSRNRFVKYFPLALLGGALSVGIFLIKNKKEEKPPVPKEIINQLKVIDKFGDTIHLK